MSPGDPASILRVRLIVAEVAEVVLARVVDVVAAEQSVVVVPLVIHVNTDAGAALRVVVPVQPRVVALWLLHAQQVEHVPLGFERGAEITAVSDSQITETGKPAPKYLRIQVEPTGDARNGGERVNIRVPLKLVKTGIKLGSLLPDSARGRVNEALGEKGIKIDVGKLDGEAVDELLSALTSLSIDVDDEKEKVRIFCE